jgi:hypothetical protein
MAKSVRDNGERGIGLVLWAEVNTRLTLSIAPLRSHGCAPSVLPVTTFGEENLDRSAQLAFELCPPRIECIGGCLRACQLMQRALQLRGIAGDGRIIHCYL